MWHCLVVPDYVAFWVGSNFFSGRLRVSWSPLISHCSLRLVTLCKSRLGECCWIQASENMVKRAPFGFRHSRVEGLTLPFTNCGTFGKFPDLSELQFPPLKIMTVKYRACFLSLPCFHPQQKSPAWRLDLSYPHILVVTELGTNLSSVHAPPTSFELFVLVISRRRRRDTYSAPAPARAGCQMLCVLGFNCCHSDLTPISWSISYHRGEGHSLQASEHFGSRGLSASENETVRWCNWDVSMWWMRSFFHGSKIPETSHCFELEDIVTVQPTLTLFIQWVKCYFIL